MQHQTIAEFNRRDEAEAVTRALIAALDAWECDLSIACHLWHCEGWTVSSEAVRPHVDVSLPDGGHASFDRTTPDSALAALRGLGAPLDEHTEMQLVNDLTAGWVL